MAQPTREKFKVYKNVFDNHSIANLFKLASRGYFDELISPISIGKEANIFTASTKEGGIVIIKIYRLENCNFNKMYDYIKYDPRFVNLKKQRRKVIFSWTQREYRNLMTSREAGVRVPMPIAFLDNILVLELIGDREAAPTLKDCAPTDPAKFFDDLLLQVKKMYDAGVIHGDLSQFNILNYKDKPVLIDMSQGTPPNSPMADELIERDVKNVLSYFLKLGVKKDASKVLSYVKGKKLPD